MTDTFEARVSKDLGQGWEVWDRRFTIARKVSMSTAHRIADLLNEHGLGTNYDRIAVATGVSRLDVKRVLLAAGYSG